MIDLAYAIAQAQEAVDADEFLWGDPEGENYGIGQDTAEAEESGRLIGYLEGLKAAQEILRKEVDTPASQS